MIFVIVIIILSVMRGIYAVFAKNVQEKYSGNFAQDMYFTMMFFLLQFIFLMIFPPYRPLHIEPAQFFNPAMFGVLSVAATVLFFTAMRIGSTALTNIVNNFSMLVPIIIGLLFWNESISILQIFGIALVLAALFFFNAKTKAMPERPDNEVKRSGIKWLLAALAAALAVGFSVFFTKRNSLQYPDYFKEYLLLLCAVTVIVTLPYVLWAAVKKKIKLIPDIRFIYLVAVMAVIQDIYNIFYTIYVGRVNSALFFPVTGITATLAVVICSRIFLREKLSVKANIGIALSIIAIALLSI
jgi:drug/metabolite transporter (DMT)-like permease